MKPRIGYMCRTDYEHELGAAAGGNIIFPSITELKERYPCVDECGVVKVEVTLIEEVEKGTM